MRPELAHTPSRSCTPHAVCTATDAARSSAPSAPPPGRPGFAQRPRGRHLRGRRPGRPAGRLPGDRRVRVPAVPARARRRRSSPTGGRARGRPPSRRRAVAGGDLSHATTLADAAPAAPAPVAVAPLVAAPVPDVRRRWAGRPAVDAPSNAAKVGGQDRRHQGRRRRRPPRPRRPAPRRRPPHASTRSSARRSRPRGQARRQAVQAGLGGRRRVFGGLRRRHSLCQREGQLRAPAGQGGVCARRCHGEVQRRHVLAEPSRSGTCSRHGGAARSGCDAPGHTRSGGIVSRSARGPTSVRSGEGSLP